jgi:hypothetical protein
MAARGVLLATVLSVVLVPSPHLDAMSQAPTAPPPTPPTGPGTVNPDAQTMAEFGKRVEQYAALHRKIEGTLPALPDEASPKQIDTHQRAFAAAMAKARPTAKQGELFTPPMQNAVRRLIGQLFAGPRARRQLRDSIMDDNPAGQVRLAVNARYPDEVPLSTMPPDVLKNLPKLPKEVEYRFVGEHLILLDPDAHIVVDVMPRALPR